MSRTDTRVGIKDYAAAHPSRRVKRFRPSPITVLRRRWRFLLKRLQPMPIQPMGSGDVESLTQADLPPSTPLASVTPNPMLRTAVEEKGSPPSKCTAVVRTAVDDQHAEILNSAQRLQLAQEPKPDRRRVQQTIAGAKAELILSRMGIRLKGTIKARQAREAVLYSNVGARPPGLEDAERKPRPAPPPSQSQNP